MTTTMISAGIATKSDKEFRKLVINATKVDPDTIEQTLDSMGATLENYEQAGQWYEQRLLSVDAMAAGDKARSESDSLTQQIAKLEKKPSKHHVNPALVVFDDKLPDSTRALYQKLREALDLSREGSRAKAELFHTAPAWIDDAMDELAVEGRKIQVRTEQVNEIRDRLAIRKDELATAELVRLDRELSTLRMASNELSERQRLVTERRFEAWPVPA